ncbi:hypothetical protein [Streptantibioticus ferralitis]|uniref:Uncharacterized protein n=1 Tax=Streptantibioticus ferralitis TaxID=236510 RepID=A0ABT5YV49_9ACTN|nr:hypothetical protein [Streptantibioticus ferralitis]MDF2255358.1 hypothetical protein [Streptantibioticus ferralitis]
MNKPIAADRFEAAICLVPPRQRTDQNGQPRKDRDGVIQWVVSVAVTANNGRRTDSEVIEVVLSGEPQGITTGMPVKIIDLWHNDWEIEGRTGVTWSAAAITAGGPVSSGRGGKSGGDA